MVISGEDVRCSVVFGTLVGVFVASVMWSELLMTSAIRCYLWYVCNVLYAVLYVCVSRFVVHGCDVTRKYINVIVICLVLLKDMMFCLRQLQEKCIEQDQHLYMVFVDFAEEIRMLRKVDNRDRKYAYWNYDQRQEWRVGLRYIGYNKRCQAGMPTGAKRLLENGTKIYI